MDQQSVVQTSIAKERVGSDERGPHSDVWYRHPHHCSRAVPPGPSVLVCRPIGFENYLKSSAKIVLSSQILATSPVLFSQATASILGSSNHCMQCQCAEVEIPSLSDRTMWGPVGHLFDYTKHVQVNDKNVRSQIASSFDPKQSLCDPIDFCLNHHCYCCNAIWAWSSNGVYLQAATLHCLIHSPFTTD